MKKITFLLIFVTIFFLNTNSLKAQSYEKGSMVLNLGVGLGGNLDVGVGVAGSFEIGFWPTGDFGVIGLGVVSGYVISTQTFNLYDEEYSEFSIGPRGTYHFTIIPVENLDVYAAADLLFVAQRTSYNNNTFDPLNSSTVVAGAVAGARYYFSDFFAVYAEVGYSVMFLSGGVAFKFK